MTATILQFRPKKKPPTGKVSILLGAATCDECPHCQDVLYHAMAMPHAVEGKACRSCDIFYDGPTDIYN